MLTPANISHARPRAFRALFLSDLHLATRASQSEQLLAFLKAHDADTIYLVGDIVDFWRLKRGARWRRSQSEVVEELLEKARAGARIIYIPGNHDSELRKFAGHDLGWFKLRLDAIHTGADGRRYLVMHGDEFDVVIRRARWLAVLGDIAYDIALATNSLFNGARRFLGLPYWSLSAWLKYRVKRAVSFIGKYEQMLADAARSRGAQGIICGHIHRASMQDIDGILYINTGDWVESGTAVVEHYDGTMEIIRWIEEQRTGVRLPEEKAYARQPETIL